MAKFHGKNVLAQFCEAVGLNPRQWRVVEIRMAVDEAVTIRAEGYAELEAEDSLQPIFEEFYLVKKSDGQKVGPVTKFAMEGENVVHA